MARQLCLDSFLQTFCEVIYTIILMITVMNGPHTLKCDINLSLAHIKSKEMFWIVGISLPSCFSNTQISFLCVSAIFTVWLPSSSHLFASESWRGKGCGRWSMEGVHVWSTHLTLLVFQWLNPRIKALPNGSAVGHFSKVTSKVTRRVGLWPHAFWRCTSVIGDNVAL